MLQGYTIGEKIGTILGFTVGIGAPIVAVLHYWLF